MWYIFFYLKKVLFVFILYSILYPLIKIFLIVLADGNSEDFGNDNLPSRTPSPLGTLIFDDLNNID